MNMLLVFLALLLTALPIVAQTKTLVAKNRTPIAVAGDYLAGFALPTTCDEQEHLYIKLFEPGPGNGMKGPLFRLSSTGVVEAKFDTSGELINRYAARPDGGVIMIHSDGSGKFVDNFAPDGTRESSVALERPPVPFFPFQFAVFNSGEILVSGLQYGYKAATAIFDRGGRLVKQVVLDGDVVIENAIANDTRAQQQNIRAIDWSMAITGDDGLVYLMKATSPVTVYAILSAGEVLHQIVVRAPSGKASPPYNFGIRVAKNRLVVQFPNAYTVVDATTGEQLATYESDKEAGTMACFLSDPDRFLIFSQNKHGLDIVEAEPKLNSPLLS